MQDEMPVISEDSDAGNTCERLAQRYCSDITDCD